LLTTGDPQGQCVSIIFIQKSTYFPEGRSFRYNDLILFEKMDSAMTWKRFSIE
jgi:hypothetical protein